MSRNDVLGRSALVAGQVGLACILVVLWQIGSERHVVDPFFVSKPSAIWRYLVEWASASKNSSTLWQDLEATVMVFGLGYGLGVGLGIVLGLLVGMLPAFRAVAEPYIAFFNAMPRIVLLPLLLVVLGFGYLPQVLLVMLVILFIVLVNVAVGVSEVRKEVLNHARILGANRLALIRHVYLPSVGLWVLSSARVTVGYALQATVAAEVIGVGRGLGFRLIIAETQYRADEMFAVFAVLLVLAIALDMVLGAVERRVRRWVPSVAPS